MPPKKPATKGASKTPRSKTSPTKKTGAKKPAASWKSPTKTTKPAASPASSKPDAAAAATVKSEAEVKVNFKDINDVLLKDEVGTVFSDGRWRVVIDETARVGTFLRYQNVNYLNIMDERELQPEIIRKSLLGSIRWDKPWVLDMMDADMYDLFTEKVNEIHKGLMEDVVSKEVIKEEKYKCLIRDSDGDDYELDRFPMEYKYFRVIFLTKLEPGKLGKSIQNKTSAIRVVMG